MMIRSREAVDVRPDILLFGLGLGLDSSEKYLNNGTSIIEDVVRYVNSSKDDTRDQVNI